MNNEQIFHSVNNAVSEEIDTALKVLADLLISEAAACNTIGVDGKSGVALFLFHYARYAKNKYYHQQAEILIESANDSIDEKSNGAYDSGVAGFGCVVMFLVRGRFIELEPDEFFSDIDKFIDLCIDIHAGVFLNSLSGVTGMGRYFIERIRQAEDPASDMAVFNHRALNDIVDFLVCPYNSYDEILHAVDALTLVATVEVENKKVRDFLAYAADKLETMRYEDNYFSVNLTRFNYARFALAFLKAAACTKSARYASLAAGFLKNDARYNEIAGGETTVMADVTIADLLLYNTIACHLGDSVMKSYCLKTLGRFSPDNLMIDPNTDTTQIPFGLINGYAAIGMALMYNTGVISGDWLELIPVVY